VQYTERDLCLAQTIRQAFSSGRPREQVCRDIRFYDVGGYRPDYLPDPGRIDSAHTTFYELHDCDTSADGRAKEAFGGDWREAWNQKLSLCVIQSLGRINRDSMHPRSLWERNCKGDESVLGFKTKIPLDLIHAYHSAQ
jgi:hypothetical protein